MLVSFSPFLEKALQIDGRLDLRTDHQKKEKSYGYEDAAARESSIYFAQFFVGQLDFCDGRKSSLNHLHGFGKLVLTAMKQSPVDDQTVGSRIVGQLHVRISVLKKD